MNHAAQALSPTPTLAPASGARTTSIDTTVVDPSRLPYAELFPGVEVKVLRVGEGSGTYTVLTRFAPGVEIPKHRHHGCVHAHTLSGRWKYAEYAWVAEAGSYIFEPSGSEHTLIVPADNEGPTEVLFVIDQQQDYMDENGALILSDSAETVYARYLAALEGKGIALPDGVVLP